MGHCGRFMGFLTSFGVLAFEWTWQVGGLKEVKKILARCSGPQQLRRSILTKIFGSPKNIFDKSLESKNGPTQSCEAKRLSLAAITFPDVLRSSWEISSRNMGVKISRRDDALCSVTLAAGVSMTSSVAMSQFQTHNVHSVIRHAQFSTYH